MKSYNWFKRIAVIALSVIMFACILPAQAASMKIAGDINSDGLVNLKDVIILSRYLSDKEVFVDIDALDVNGDGEVDNADVDLLFKYTSGWQNITIHRHNHTLQFIEAKEATASKPA